MMRWGVLALACFASTASCYSPKLTGCAITCGNPLDNECPAGLTCTAGFCRGANDTCVDAGTDGRLFKTITAGHEHACAITLDGKLFCWGANLHGQVKEQPSTTETIGVPVAVDGVVWDKVEAGQAHTCAIGVDAGMTRHVYCWGSNKAEQCGVDASGNDEVHVPVEVQGLTDPVEIAAGDNHTCARTGEGRMFCWGDNTNGQLGTGAASATTSEVPSEVDGGATDWNLITAGAATTCATKTDGSAFCWGRNDSGQIGNGSTSADVPSPDRVVVMNGGPITAISLNGVVGCLVQEDPGPVLRCWGNNASGEAGQDSGTPKVVQPNTMVGIGNMGIWASVSTGVDFACGLTTAGKIHCWGADDERLGDDDVCFGCRAGFGPQPTETVKPDTDAAFAIAVGDEFGCALFGESATTGGVARCWGKNEHGQLGNATATRIPRASPTAATGSWLTVRLGQAFGCGIQSDNTTWCWGDNTFKQVSPAVVAKEASPVPRADATGAIDIALGDNHACALVSTTGPNPVRCWGSNAVGELGDANTNLTMTSPTLPVNGDWKSIHASDNTTCVARVNNEYVCWGTASWLPSAPAITSPMQVAFLNNFTSLRLGPDSGCAISSGQLACFGPDTNELRGTGADMELPATPTAVKFGAMVLVGVLGSSDTDNQGRHRCSFTAANTFCWAHNDHGQAGGSSSADVSTAESRFAQPFITAAGTELDRTIVSGAEFTCAIAAADHTARCWGSNGQQQITEAGPAEDDGGGAGEPTKISVSASAPVMTFRTLAAGSATVCGITDDATRSLLCWGASGRGEAATGDSDKDLLVDVVTF